jgi:transposase
LDETLPDDHKTRSVWAFVNNLDTSPVYEDIKSIWGKSGRPATSPKILLALWIYSILDGNMSARKLDELCRYHVAYKWIAGGAEINRTMLADFRIKNSFKFDELLTNCLAVMVQSGLINDRDFSQDGSRIKANAGFASFRREDSLNELKEEIQNHLKLLEKEKDYDKRKKAELINKNERVKAALRSLEEDKARKVNNGKKNRQPPSEEDLKKVRASTTDPDCRKMKMGDGGYRLAYNVQFATGVDSRVIFGVDVVNTLDPGTSPKMMSNAHSRLDALGILPPKNWLTDSAYSGKEDVENVANLFPDCRYISPAKVRKGCNPKKHQKTDTEAVKKWRDSLDDPSMKEIYKKKM